MTPDYITRVAVAIDPDAFAIPDTRQSYYRRRQHKARQAAERALVEIRKLLIGAEA